MPYLLAVTGPYTGQAFEVRDGRMTVGRGPACDLLLADDTAISRAHAVLVTAGGLVQVQDAGSTYGVHVNGRRVDQAVLKTGDCVQLGASLFQVQPVPAQVSEPPRLKVVLPPRQGGIPGVPQEDPISPAWGCFIAIIAILIPIPYGLHVGLSYMRKSNPANARYGSLFLVASGVSLLLQLLLAVWTWHKIAPLLGPLRDLLGSQYGVE